MTTIPRLPLAAAVSALALGLAAPALADIGLPAPYVSRALDAVLMPIDGDVRAAFDLYDDDEGALVLAVEPGGVADAGGIVPGDVLASIDGRRIARPIDVDTVVYYWIVEGYGDFAFDVQRDGGYHEVATSIDESSYSQVIEVSSIAAWSSWSTETSFSYEELTSEYSETMTESYASSEATIEETVASEEYASAMAEEVSDDGEAMSEEDEAAMAAQADEDLAAEDAGEDMAESDTSGDEVVEEEPAEDDGGEEEVAEAEVAEDDGGDEGGDEGGGEEE